MIITRTPFRISFFGGGTDYPLWYRENGGSVLSTSIDKYCYISCRKLPPFFEYKHRIVYSKIENVVKTCDILHPSVKAIIKWSNIADGLEIHHDADLPARSGLGSSSAFTVGLINAIYLLKGIKLNHFQLASNAIHIEQDIIKENVGSQDQIATAYGGFNRINFKQNNSYEVIKLPISDERLKEFKSRLLLCFTGFSRIADTVAKSQLDNFKNCSDELSAIKNMVEDSIEILLNNNKSIDELGKLFDLSWHNKKKLSNMVSTGEIDEIYKIALKSGAFGGKLLGAGGGGFMLLFAPAEKHLKIKENLKSLLFVDFEFEKNGSSIILNQPLNYMK